MSSLLVPRWSREQRPFGLSICIITDFEVAWAPAWDGLLHCHGAIVAASFRSRLYEAEGAFQCILITLQMRSAFGQGQWRTEVIGIFRNDDAIVPCRRIAA